MHAAAGKATTEAVAAMRGQLDPAGDPDGSHVGDGDDSAIGASPKEQAAAAAAVRADRSWQRLSEASRDCAPLVQAELLGDWASAAMALRDADRRYALETRRLALADSHGLTGQAAIASARLGTMLTSRGEFDLARQRFAEARERFAQLGDKARLADVHSELSRLERRISDYLAALREERTALELRRQAGQDGLWRSLLSVAVLYEQIELFDEARRHYAEALAEAERDGDPGSVSRALSGYAGFLSDFGARDAPQALLMAERALAIERGLGDTVRVGSALLQVGRAQMNLGRVEEADASLRAALQAAEAVGARSLWAHVQFRRGELAMLQGELDEALALVGAAREEYERQGNRHRLAKVHGVLEPLHAARGEPLEAARSGREHYRLRNQLLGADAANRLGELLNNFMASEERLRNERLEQQNALAVVRLENERRMRVAMVLLAVVIASALAVLGWRHRSARRLNALLREKTQQVEAQGRALAALNAELTQHSQELQLRNQTDALTGIDSRAHGMQQLAEVLSRRSERGTEPAVLMIDVDRFKEVNDRHGHLAGDQVLVAVASALRAATPEHARLSRIGGEEFMVVIDHAPAHQAAMLADALRRRVRDLDIDLGSQVLRVTISTGVCELAGMDQASVRDVLSAADRALYRAKRDGRDCVRVAAEPA